MKMKEITTLMYAAGAVCLEWLAGALGGWDVYLVALIAAMVLDYLSGVLLAAFWHKSTKTETGRLESKAGWKGLVRKIMTLAFVGVGYVLDLVSGLGYVRKLVILGFFLNELLSLIENAGLMGLKLPAILLDTIEILSQKAEKKVTK